MPWAAMRLGRPVKWTEDRQENFYATTQERGQVHDAEMALTQGRAHPRRAATMFLFDTGAYDPYGLTIPINTPVHAARPVRHPELRQRVHRGVHEQADRDAGARRGAPARRLRERAAARPRREGARHRSRGDPQAEPARPGPLPAQPRDHVPGLGAARLRQRQLPADARARRRDDRLRAVRARGAAAAARRGTARRRRHRLLRGGHRHRPVRRARA